MTWSSSSSSPTRCSAETGKKVLEAEGMKLVNQIVALGVSILLTARVTGLPILRIWREVAVGAGDFGAAVDQEDDLGARSSATRACFRIWLGM